MTEEGFRCASCGHFVPMGKTPVKIWPTFCPDCGGKLTHEVPQRVGLFRKLFGKASELQHSPKQVQQFKKEKSSSDKPVLVMISCEGPPLEDKTFIDRILQLPEIQREVAGRRSRIRTFGEISGLRQHLDTLLGPTDPRIQREMDAYAMRKQHAPDYQGDMFWCTVTNPVDGREYEVVICQPYSQRPQSATPTNVTREKEQKKTEYQGDGVGILFDWKAIGGEGTKAWQVFCESCDPKNLLENTLNMTDVWSEACKIEIKALASRQHAFCIALPDARSEQVNYVHNAVLSNAAKFLLPETPFVPPGLVGPWGPKLGRINFEGVFTLYDGDFLWVLLRAAKAKWDCSISTSELNRFLHAVKSCSPHYSDDEIAIYAHAIGVHRLDQALANFRSDYSRSLTHWAEDERPARQKECDELIARLKRAVSPPASQTNSSTRREDTITKRKETVPTPVPNYCPRCKVLVREPSPSHSTVDYARFWRGVCPSCETPLLLRKTK